jgi:ribonuclease HII
MLAFERRAKREGYGRVIGVDEVGRGPLAGPVVAAAVCLMKYRFRERIDDSKKLSSQQRERAFREIVSNSVFDIGGLNIARATSLAAEIAVLKVARRLGHRATFRNTFLLLDGALKVDAPFPQRVIVGGDGKSLSIAAASIVAKVFRDRLMTIYDSVYPGYGFAVHKGYGTRVHRLCLRRQGPSPIHRKSFRGVNPRPR